MQPLRNCKYARKSRIKSLVKNVAAYLFYSVLLARPCKPQSCAENSMAVVFMASLGDFVVSCSFAKCLAESGKALTLICKQSNGIADFARCTGLFSEIHELDMSFSRRFSSVKSLKNLSADTVISLPPTRHIMSDVCACTIKSNQLVLADTSMGCSLPWLKKRVDTYCSGLPKITAISEYDRYNEFFIKSELLQERPELYRLYRRTDTTGRTLAVFPGAGGGMEKCWSVENFTLTIKELCRRELVSDVVVLGTKSESDFCSSLFNAISGKHHTENLCGKTDIQQLTELLKKCCLTIANDSGSSHVSVACGVPTVVICGMWQYGRFYSDVCTDNIVHPIFADGFCQSCSAVKPLCGIYPAPCVGSITPEKVIECASDLLEKERSNYD